FIAYKLRRRPCCPLFPYTTLFRSRKLGRGARPAGCGGAGDRRAASHSRNSAERRRDGHADVAATGDRAPLVGRGSRLRGGARIRDRKSTRLNSSHVKISYAVFCLK